MRYENWLRWRVAEGTPPEVADASRGAGRKLMGALMQQLELSGNLQGALRQVLPDGTEIVARFDGTTPIVEIAATATSQNEPACKGLMGHISKPVEVQDWPVDPASGYGAGDLETNFYMGTYANDVYLLYRSPHAPTWPKEERPRSMRFDPAVPAIRTYAKAVQYPRDPALVQPPVMYRDRSLGDGPLMTSAPPAPDIVDGVPAYTFPIVNVRTGQTFHWKLTLSAADVNQTFRWACAPIMVNWDGAGWAQGNTVPMFVETHQKPPTGIALTAQGVALFDYRKRMVHGPVSVFDAALGDGASLIGLKDRRLHAFGYGSDGVPTDDEFVVNVDTGARTHRKLGVKCQYGAYVQVCDTLLVVGGWQTKTVGTGDVWLYKLGGAMRKIGHIPELDVSEPLSAKETRMLASIYLVPTSRCVYLFTPVMDDTDNPVLVTKYRVRTIT